MTPESRTIPWTSEQRQAITAGAARVIVTAAAGSGKTAVLAERCAHLICDARPPCDADRLLVVTFTEAAAAEMRHRIGAALRRRADARPGDARLRRQVALLELAQISTLHAFCASLVRRWFAALALPPDMRLMDEDEAALLQRATAHDLFTRWHDPAAPESGPFRRLLDEYAGAKEDTLAEWILHTANYVRSVVDPDAWLDEAASRFRAEAGLPRPILIGWRDALAGHLERLARRADLFARRLEGAEPAARDLLQPRTTEFAETLRETARTVRAAGDETSMSAALDIVCGLSAPRLEGRAAAQRAASDTDGFDRLVKDYDRLRDRLKPLKRDWCVSIDRQCDALRQVGPVAADFVRLVRGFAVEYRAVKRRRGVMDFADLERLALRLLTGQPDVGEPPDLPPDAPSPQVVAAALRERFRHILVDEYQDTNPVQAALIEAIAGAGAPQAGSLFLVGDVRQSIYRFRLAEPQLLLECAARPGGADVLDLPDNFRSRGHIIEAVNAAFGALGERIDDPAAELMARPMRAARPYPEDGEGALFDDASVLVHVIERSPDAAEEDSNTAEDEADNGGRGDEEGDARAGETSAADDVAAYDVLEREAWFVARRIHALMGRVAGHSRRQVCGPDGTPRPLEYRDIAVLMRATYFRGGIVARVLTEEGIPCFADLSTGYLDTLEARDLVALLEVLDNPAQDVPLAAVLRSPLLRPGVRGDDLAAVRLAHRDVPFHEAVRRYAHNGPDDRLREVLRERLVRLARWRERVRRRPLAEALREILAETGYLAYVSGLPGGRHRRANVLALVELAAASVPAAPTIDRFVAFLRDMRARRRDFGAPPAVGEADNVVRIMSIHHSKGLEFPVVFLLGAGEKLNLADTRRKLLVDRRWHVAPKVVDAKAGLDADHIGTLLAREEMRRQSVCEEMRVTYVAMTRAREHLEIVGSLGGPAEVVDQAGADPPEPERAERMLDWLLPLPALRPDAVTVRQAAGPDDVERAATPIIVQTYGAEAVQAWRAQVAAAGPPPLLERVARLAPLPEEEPVAQDGGVRAVVSRLGRRYRYEEMTRTPAVVAASELKHHRDLLEDPEEPVGALVASPAPWPGPRFIRTSPLPQEQAVLRGVATHLVLQHLDVSRPVDESAVRSTIAALVSRGLLSEADAGLVDVAGICWFFGTAVGARMRLSHAALRRELMFVSRSTPQPWAGGGDFDRQRDVVLIRGIIDAAWVGPEGLELLDYKTDAVGEAEIADRVALYRPQVAAYARAAERMFGQPVTGAWLAFLTPRRIEQVALDPP